MSFPFDVPARPTRERITFRTEETEDESFLCGLYATTRAHEMALTGWPREAQEAFLRQQFQFQSIHYHRYYQNASFRIILLDGRPVGRIYLHYGSADILLIDIALLPEYRGLGIGGLMMHDLLAEAVQTNKRVLLHVEPNNPALHLYQRFGFQVVDEPNAGSQMTLLMEWRPQTNEVDRTSGEGEFAN
jgi:ribosomal protein S18 acetylase RimI-like enzyme